MRLSLLLFAVFMAGVTQAQVYRSVDKNGNVIYSDQQTKGSVKVEVKEIETVKSLDTSNLPPPMQSKQQTDESYYTNLEITSPRDDESIRENSGNLTVTTSIAPQLQAAHQLVLYMDGKDLVTSRDSSFQLQNIDRGTHQLRVVIVDIDGREQISSKPVTFHLLRFSVITVPTPQSNTPAK